MSTISDFLPSIANNSFQSLTSSCVTTPHERRNRQLNYNKTLVGGIHRIDCRSLYRVLMKIEIPFRGHAKKNLRHRFIKLLYQNACKSEPDYGELIRYVKMNIGLYISLSDTRQLVLYSALFGATELEIAPSSEDTLRVIKSCPLAVPPFTNFQKWSRDVKRLENNPLSADMMKGFFSHTQSGNSECVSIMSLREDFMQFDEMGDLTSSGDSRDYCSDSHGEDDDDDDDDDNDDDDDEKDNSLSPNFALSGKRDVKSILVNKTKSLMLLSRLFESRKEKESQKDRKKGVLNLYERSDNHELNKMILALSRGNKEYVEPEKEVNLNDIAHRFSRVFTQGEAAHRSRLIRFDSIKETSDDNDHDDDFDFEEQEELEMKKQQEEIEKKKKEELKMKKRKHKISKLTEGAILRPSLAKMNMIQKLSKKRDMVTGLPCPSESSSRNSRYDGAAPHENAWTENQDMFSSVLGGNEHDERLQSGTN